MVAWQRAEIFGELENIFDARQLRIANVESDLDLDAGKIRFEFIITEHHSRIGQELTREIMAVEGVQRIKFR